VGWGLGDCVLLLVRFLNGDSLKGVSWVVRFVCDWAVEGVFVVCVVGAGGGGVGVGGRCTGRDRFWWVGEFWVEGWGRVGRGWCGGMGRVRISRGVVVWGWMFFGGRWGGGSGWGGVLAWSGGGSGGGGGVGDVGGGDVRWRRHFGSMVGVGEVGWCGGGEWLAWFGDGWVWWVSDFDWVLFLGLVGGFCLLAVGWCG